MGFENPNKKPEEIIESKIKKIRAAQDETKEERAKRYKEEDSASFEERIARFEQSQREEAEFAIAIREAFEAGTIDKNSKLGRELAGYLYIEEEVDKLRKQQEERQRSKPAKKERSSQEVAGDILGELAAMAELNKRAK